MYNVCKSIGYMCVTENGKKRDETEKKKRERESWWGRGADCVGLFGCVVQATALKQQLSRDGVFLRSCNVLNHSLLMGIHKGSSLPHDIPAPVTAQSLMRGLFPAPGGGGHVSAFQHDEYENVVA